MTDFFFDHALLPSGWAENVRVEMKDGHIARVEPNSLPQDAERVRGIVIPGLPNLHSHSFQRAMAGLAETRGPSHDSFWTWRKVMYHFLEKLDADDVEAIAAFAFMEMLENGFTTVGEFHYLHHQQNGAPYGNLAELSERICVAASETGIGLTLLPVLYAYGGIGGMPPVEGQARFLNSLDQFEKLYEDAKKSVSKIKHANIGIAPHSLRAVDEDMLKSVAANYPNVPVHIHMSEQVKEVDACMAWSGQRPVEWLLSHVEVDARWCLIHATHMTDAETKALARTGATVSLCPLTEASLGDGIFNGEAYLHAKGAFGIGTDSNIEITASGEIKQLEYSQRLKHLGRNMMAQDEGQSTGRSLYQAALKGGQTALQQKVGSFEVGQRADFVVLDCALPDFERPKTAWLDSYIFSLGSRAIGAVYVGGEKLVESGQHRSHEKIAARYRRTLRKVLAA